MSQSLNPMNPLRFEAWESLISMIFVQQASQVFHLLLLIFILWGMADLSQDLWRLLSLSKWIWTLLLLCPSQIWGQEAVFAQFEGEYEIPMELIDVNDGLSQGFAANMAIDHDGYLWIATNEGLNRFDGFDFKIFRHDPRDSSSIASNIINYLFVDSNNQLWVSTNAGFLDLFLPESETFIHHHSRAGKNLGKPAVFILPSSELSGNKIIFPAFTGAIWNIVLASEPQNFKQFQVEDVTIHYPALKSILVDSSTSYYLHANRNGDIWAFGGDSLYWFSEAMLKKNLPPQSFPSFRKLGWRRMNQHTSVIIPDQKGGTYSIRGDSLLKFDPTKRAFRVELRLPPGYSFNGSAFIDSQNRLWSAMPSNDFLRVDIDKKRFRILRNNIPGVESLASENTYYACEDKQQNIWLGTNGGGFIKISNRSEIFGSLYNTESERILKLHGIYLHRVVRPGKRAVFDERLVEKWEDLSPIKLIEKRGYITKGQITQLAVDTEENYWFAANKPVPNSDVLCPVILKINTFTQKVTEMAEICDKSGVDWSPVPIIIDRDNQVWFGNFDGEDTPNLHFLDQIHNKIVKYPFPALPKPVGYPTISDWYETDEGVFWFATTIGLFSFSKEDKQWNHWENKLSDPNSLSSNIVFSVHPDPRFPKRFIWAGTSGSGLNCLDLKTNKFRHYSTKDGLPNDVIYAIQFDKRNNLWISTNQGICLFDPIRNETQTFSEVDGLLGNEFNRYQYSKSSSGTLCFGGINGSNFFDPEDFYHKEAPAKTIITSIKLANEKQEFKRNAPSTILQLKKPIELTKEVEIPADQFMISIGFSLLDLTLPTKNKFKYKLEGLSDKWIESGTKHEATYTNLNPGSYTFKVLGCSSNNVWSLEPATIGITILPPWWATWWFRSLVIISILTMLYILYRYRLANLLRMERLRNRIGQDLHDEIGSTLSSISLYSAVMQKTSEDLPPQTISILNKIIDSTSQMMESMNDMVWTIKASNDSFDQVVNRMRAFAVNMTEVQDIFLDFNVAPDVEKLRFSMGVRKNIYLIFKEAVNNAVKYSKCSQLSISFKRTRNSFTLIIEDNGVGFDPNNQVAKERLMGGNGMNGMKTRSEEINSDLEIKSEIGKGTTIKLKLVL